VSRTPRFSGARNDMKIKSAVPSNRRNTMNRFSKSFGLTTALLLSMSHRCPAPIQEVQETPTPSPTATVQSTAAPTPQPIPTAKPVAVSDATGAARFAGAWTGKINMQKLGDVEVTLTISADGTSLQQGSRMGRAQRPLTYNGKILSWQAGAQNNIPWTLSPNADGQTAVVTRTVGGATSTATFQRAQTSPKPTPAPVRKYPGVNGKRNSGN
jgi:hypothetical protein